MLFPTMPDAGQGVLFEEHHDIDETLGYRSPSVQKLVGITYRQLDNWTRTGLIVPRIRSAKGSGTQRLYSFRDILELKVIKNLLDTGISLQQIRKAVEHLRYLGYEDISRLTLMSDGASIYEVSDPEEIIDLLKGGCGVFAIDLATTLNEAKSEVLELPSEKTYEPSLIDINEYRLKRAA
ncbi:MAG: MerR family transcriptional regulator [Micrococcaceae bacterium]